MKVLYNASKTFIITPDAGYPVSDVLVDGVSVGAVTSHTFKNVKANHTIHAIFKAMEFAITATAGEGGTIGPAGTVVVDYDTDKTFSITADTGFLIDDVRVDGSSIGAVGQPTTSPTSGEPHHCGQLQAAAVHHLGHARAPAARSAPRARLPSITVLTRLSASRPTRATCRRPGGRRQLGGRASTGYTFGNVTADHTLCGHLCAAVVHHHGDRRQRRHDQPLRRSRRGLWRNQTFAHHARDRLPWWPTCGSTAASVGAVTSYTFNNVAGQPHHRRQLRNSAVHHHGHGRHPRHRSAPPAR